MGTSSTAVFERGVHPGHRPGAATTVLLEGVTRRYTVGAGTVTALSDVSLEIDAGFVKRWSR